MATKSRFPCFLKHALLFHNTLQFAIHNIMAVTITTKIKDYVSRIGHRRGFGIQSPWAYSFVRDVIAEDLPYYGYDSISKETRTDKKNESRMARLLLRLGNFVRPDSYTDITQKSSFFAHFIALGCTKCTETSIPQGRAIIHANLKKNSVSEILNIASRCDDKSMLMLTGLCLEKDIQQSWLTIRNNNSIGITFDLGRFALCFLDKSMHKQHYKLFF